MAPISVGTFVANISVILGVMAVLALVELAVPFFAGGVARRGRTSANFALTALTFFLNWGFTGLAGVIALWLSIGGHGLLAALGLSLPVCVAISIVTLDLSTYFAHRSMHKSALLWRVHQVHHCDPFLDVTSSFRQHPLEGLWRFLFILVPTWLLGLPVEGVLIYRLLSAVQAVFEHANIRVWQPFDSVLSLIWVTPNMHKIHHSREPRQTDSNYGNLLSLFDRLARTFQPTNQAHAVRYGLASVADARAKSLSALIAMPFSEMPFSERSR